MRMFKRKTLESKSTLYRVTPMENGTVVVQERSDIRTVGHPDDNKEKSKLEKLVGEVRWKTGRQHQKKS